MSNLSALQAAWVTEIAKISNALIKAEATQALDAYIAARTAQTAELAGQIQSYSIAGRTFTRYNRTDATRTINGLLHDLTGYVYGSVSLIDLNEETDEP